MNPRLRELIASASEAQKRYPLVYSFNNYSGPVVSGAVMGGLGVHAVNIALGHVIATDDSFKVWVLVGIVIGVVIRVLFVARRQGKVMIEINADDIRELDGDRVRLKIPWDEARAAVTKFRARVGRTRQDVLELRFVARDGEMIVLSDVDRPGFFPKYHFRVVSRHALVLEKEIAELLPQVPETTPDPREKRFGAWYGSLLSVLATLAGYAVLVFFASSLGGLADSRSFKNYGLGPRAAFSAMFAFAPLVHFLRELFRSRRTDDDRTRAYVRVRAAVLALAIATPWIAGWRLSVRCHELNPEPYDYTGYRCYD